MVYLDFDGMYSRDECYECEGMGHVGFWQPGTGYRLIGPPVACDVCEGTGKNPNPEPDEHDWDNFIECLQDRLGTRYPSLVEADEWPERECHTIMENQHAIFAVSEYCGLVSVSMRAKEDDYGYDEHVGLHQSWSRRVAPGFQNFMAKAFGQYCLSRMGGFSDGTSVYQRVKLSA